MWTDDRPRVPCGLCGTPTPMTGTKRCDRCWELESRIHGDPALAQKILDGMNKYHRAVDDLSAVSERAEQLAEALREMREYVTAALQAQREAFAGYEHCSDIPGIEADLHKIDTLLREQENDDA